jgi:hypothetical protein
LAHAVGSGQIGLHFATGKALEGFCPLVWCERRRPSKLDATGLGSGSAVTCTGKDQLAFELSEATKDS